MESLPNLGLWGDGDEIWAIDAAFEAVGMEVPVEDASTWITVGDVWKSAIRRQPALGHDPSCWDEFRKAISGETAAAWEQVGPETALLDGKGHNILSRLVKGTWQRVMGNA